MEPRMHRAIPVAVALIVLLEAAAFAGPRHDAGQEVRFSANSQVVAGKTQAEAQRRLPEVSALSQLVVLTRTNGKPLTCAEIRAMDEVELITDESYCR